MALVGKGSVRRSPSTLSTPSFARYRSSSSGQRSLGHAKNRRDFPFARPPVGPRIFSPNSVVLWVEAKRSCWRTAAPIRIRELAGHLSRLHSAKVRFWEFVERRFRGKMRHSVGDGVEEIRDLE